MNKYKHTKKKPEAAGGAEVQGAEVGAGGGRNPKINREIKNLPPPKLKAKMRPRSLEQRQHENN